MLAALSAFIMAPLLILVLPLIPRANAASVESEKKWVLGVSDYGKANSALMKRVEVMASGEVSDGNKTGAASMTRLRPSASGEVLDHGRADETSMMRVEVSALGEILYDNKERNTSTRQALESISGEVSRGKPRYTEVFSHGGNPIISSALETQHVFTAIHRARVPGSVLLIVLAVMTLFVLTAVLILVVFFPHTARDIVEDTVDQMISINRRIQDRVGGRDSIRIQEVSVQDHDFFNDYEIGEKLGEGMFGVVHVVRREGKSFAAKMIDLMECDLQLIHEEVTIMKRVKHDRLTTGCLYEYSDQCFYYLVMPLYTGGDLSGAVSDYIEQKGLLPEALFAKLFEQMTKGIAFVHSKQVVHRDVKPENFLLGSSKLTDPGNRVVVADFGMSTVLDDGGFLSETCGTPIFFSPEIFAGKYEFKVDVFALGLSAYVLLTGGFAFASEKESKTWAGSSALAPIPTSISPDTEEIFIRALARDASHRASAKELENLATKLRTHSFDDIVISKRESIEPPKPKIEGCRTMGISGGVEQMNKAQRRYRMLRELIKDHHGKDKRCDDADESNISTDLLAARPFEIKGGRRNRRISRFEFWSEKDCLDKRVSGIKDAEMRPRRRASIEASADQFAYKYVEQLLVDVLSRYSIDRCMWGRGKAKSTFDLAKECRDGKCRLTEDQNKLERIVEVVAFFVMNNEDRILHQIKEFPREEPVSASKRKMKMLAVPSSGANATVGSSSEPRLPAKKMEPWETVREAAQRILVDLNMTPEDVELNFDVPMRVVKESSPSYPGLMTVYKKHIVEVSIRDGCSFDRLALWGLPGSKTFVVKTKEENLKWIWRSRNDSVDTVTEGEEGLAMRYAEDLPVKTKNFDGDAIKQILKQTSAKVEDIPDAVVEELAKQISRGEVDLVNEEGPDGTQNWKRKVTVTMLRLVNQEGSILLEVSTSKDGGTTWADKTSLPADPQHIFENPYNIARRMLTSRFMVAEGRWRMDKSLGGCIMEETESDQLLGLPTTYTKHIVAARLC